MMHIITIKKNDVGMFDVLINGINYRIHRCMNADDALNTALDIQREFNVLNEHSKIICGYRRSKQLSLEGQTMYIDQETKVNLLSGCFSKLEYKPHTHVQQYDTFKYMYVDILELRDIIDYNGQLLVAVLANPLKDYIKGNMLYNEHWPSYYIKLFKGNSPDSFKIVVKYNQIIGSRFIGEYPIDDLLQLIKKA